MASVSLARFTHSVLAIALIVLAMPPHSLSAAPLTANDCKAITESTEDLDEEVRDLATTLKETNVEKYSGQADQPLDEALQKFDSDRKAALAAIEALKSSFDRLQSELKQKCPKS